MYDVELTLCESENGTYMGKIEIPYGALYIKKIKIICGDKISLAKLLSDMVIYYKTYDGYVSYSICEFICQATINGKIICDYNELKIKLGKKCIVNKFDGSTHISIVCGKHANIKIAFSHKDLQNQIKSGSEPAKYRICIFKKNSRKNTHNKKI